MPQRYDWAVENVRAAELKKQLTSLDSNGFEIINVFPFKVEWTLDSSATEVLIVARRPKLQA